MPIKPIDIDPSEVRKSFSYNPTTGILRWKVTDSRKVKPGDEAGCASPKEGGRKVVVFRYKHIRTHILIWAFQTGEWPKNQIDHINRNPGDNRWINLRESTQGQNMKNTKTPITNKSGFRGVYWHKTGGRWTSQIRVDGKKIYLGMFDTAEAAHKVYKAASEKLHGVFSHYRNHILPSIE
jgi:hypothetical protein